MPSTISLLPAPAPASASAPATFSSDQPSGDSGASFDSALNQATPSSGKSGARTSVTGSARANIEAEKAAKAAIAEKADKAAIGSAADAKSSANQPELLTPEELAALLALIGAPLAFQPPPPPPAVPADFNPAGGTRRSPESADISADCEANFAAPQFTTGKDRDVFIPDAPGLNPPGVQESDTKDVFTLAAAPLPGTTDEVTARDLLKQGAEVIDYQLQSEIPLPPTAAASGIPIPADMMAPEQMPVVTVASTTPAARTNTDTPAAAPAVTDSAIESATFAQQASASASQPLDSAALRRFSAQKTSSRNASEKIAANVDSGVSPTTSGVKTSIDANKNNFLNVTDKELAQDMKPVGTDAANWGDSMNQDSRSTPFVARLIDGALSLLGTSAAGTTTMDRPSDTAATPAVSSAQAAQIVSEIRDIADGLWAVERNSVEVRFNFSETERLSVKVEYRDGVVKTTFRTDSPELRDTIAREWQSQVASSSDSRPYRVADPVFNTPPADARGFSLGGDSSRQQRQAEQSGNAPHAFATASGRGQSSSSVAAAPVTTFTRPDTAIHLHAFA